MKNITELIVLNHTKFREDSIVLHTLSRDYGRRSFLIRVGKKTGMALFLPLNILEVEVTENPKSDLWFADHIVSVLPLNGIRNNLYKNTMTLFMSEVLYRTVKDGAQEDGLYEWCRGSIVILDALESDFSNFHIRFLLEFAVALGFRPEVGDIAPFAGENLVVLDQFLKASLSESMLLPLTGETRNAIADSLIRYIEFHTESTINIHSLTVLRDLYR